MAKKTSKKLLTQVEEKIESNQSKISMVLGALIILVVGILVFNYFKRSEENLGNLGPAQQTGENEQKADVTRDRLPGPYTVKEGDTLFTIAEKYYQDGFKFEEIATTNKLTNPDEIAAGQVLQIPKVETQQATASGQSSETAKFQPGQEPLGTGGGNTTIWGPRIEGNTYTVEENDWLSKIAGRAYGDIFTYEKIARANNIANPDYIEPGLVLIIPR